MLNRIRNGLREAVGSGAFGENHASVAAVLIPITDEPEPHVILTVRTAGLRVHGGEVAFPGGKRDAADPSLAHTALRETHEEIGLDPAVVEVLAPGFARRSRLGILVQPYVGIVPGDVRLEANTGELAEIFRVPLGWLLTRENMTLEEWPWDGRPVDCPRYVFGGRHVFGMTAQMLVDVLNAGCGFGITMRE